MWVFFGVKMCKMGNFFYFARVYTCWCGYSICTITVALTFDILLFFSLSFSLSIWLSLLSHLNSLLLPSFSSYIPTTNHPQTQINLDLKFIKPFPQYIYIYIYIYQTQIAKEGEENAKIVKEQGSEKICPKSPPKLRTQNYCP